MTKAPLKVVIAGSRTITDFRLVLLAVLRSGFEIAEVVCGDAHGADRLGARYAHHKSIPVKHFPADWERLGKKAGIIRNGQMVDYADAVIVVWDGKSRGSLDTIIKANIARKPCYILVTEGEAPTSLPKNGTLRVETLAQAR